MDLGKNVSSSSNIKDDIMANCLAYSCDLMIIKIYQRAVPLYINYMLTIH